MNGPQRPASPKNSSRSSIPWFRELPYVKLNRKWDCLDEEMSHKNKTIYRFKSYKFAKVNASVENWQISAYYKKGLANCRLLKVQISWRETKVPYVQKQQQASPLAHGRQVKRWVDLHNRHAIPQRRIINKDTHHTNHKFPNSGAILSLFWAPNSINFDQEDSYCYDQQERYRSLQKSREPTHSAVLAFHKRTSLSRLPLASTSELAGWKRTYKNKHHLEQTAGKHNWFCTWLHGSCVLRIVISNSTTQMTKTLRESKTATLQINMIMLPYSIHKRAWQFVYWHMAIYFM